MFRTLYSGEGWERVPVQDDPTRWKFRRLDNGIEESIQIFRGGFFRGNAPKDGDGGEFFSWASRRGPLLILTGQAPCLASAWATALGAFEYFRETELADLMVGG